MVAKKQLGWSVLLGVAGGVAAYALAWGLFTTHPEIGMDPRSARAVALWAAPLVFLASLIYFGVRASGRK